MRTQVPLELLESLLEECPPAAPHVFATLHINLYEPSEAHADLYYLFEPIAIPLIYRIVHYHCKLIFLVLISQVVEFFGEMEDGFPVEVWVVDVALVDLVGRTRNL